MILYVKTVNAVGQDDFVVQPTLFGRDMDWVLQPDQDCYENFSDGLVGTREIGCCYTLWVRGAKVKSVDGIMAKWRKTLREQGDTVLHKIRTIHSYLSKNREVFTTHFTSSGKNAIYSGCNVHLGKVEIGRASCRERV